MHCRATHVSNLRLGPGTDSFTFHSDNGQTERSSVDPRMTEPTAGRQNDRLKQVEMELSVG
jgi:hypothetical protein